MSEETKRSEAFIAAQSPGEVTRRGDRQVHEPLRKGELDCVLDESIATGADDEGGPRLDAVLHHHVGRNATRVQGDLRGVCKGRRGRKVKNKNSTVKRKGLTFLPAANEKLNFPR